MRPRAAPRNNVAVAAGDAPVPPGWWLYVRMPDMLVVRAPIETPLPDGFRSVRAGDLTVLHAWTWVSPAHLDYDQETEIGLCLPTVDTAAVLEAAKRLPEFLLAPEVGRLWRADVARVTTLRGGPDMVGLWGLQFRLQFPPELRDLGLNLDSECESFRPPVLPVENTAEEATFDWES